MECPFEKLQAKYSKLLEMWIVKNIGGKVLFFDLTENQAVYIVQAINSHEKLEEALAWLLEEYHFFSRKMTEINNIVQPLWGELRERRNDYQLVEDFIEQIKEKGLEQALEAEKQE